MLRNQGRLQAASVGGARTRPCNPNYVYSRFCVYGLESAENVVIPQSKIQDFKDDTSWNFFRSLQLGPIMVQTPNHLIYPKFVIV